MDKKKKKMLYINKTHCNNFYRIRYGVGLFIQKEHVSIRRAGDLLIDDTVASLQARALNDYVGTRLKSIRKTKIKKQQQQYPGKNNINLRWKKKKTQSYTIL